MTIEVEQSINELSRLQQRVEALESKEQQWRQTQDRLLTYTHQMEMLHQTALEINDQPDMPALLQTIVERAADLLTMPMGALYFLDTSTNILRLVAAHNYPYQDNDVVNVAWGQGIVGRVAQLNAPVAVDDYQAWAHRVRTSQLSSVARRILAVPLMQDTQVLGVLLAADDVQTGAFAADEIHLLSMLAAQTAIVMRKDRLQARIQYELDERTRVTARLHRSEAYLRSVVDNVVDGIVIASEQGLITMVNPAMEKIFGYAAAELVGQPLTILMPDAYAAAHDGYIQAYLETGHRKIMGYGREVAGKHKNGTTFPLDLAVSEFFLDSTRMFIGTLRDITERRQLQDQLRLAHRMEAVGRLAGGIAHDFNNVLTIINGYVDLLLTQTNGNEDFTAIHADLEQIKRASNRAKSLTRQLLLFSRQQPLRPQLLNLNQVIEVLRRMVDRLMHENITIAVDLEAGLGMIESDPSQLEQIVMNLIINARDAMPKGGLLTVQTRNVIVDDNITDCYIKPTPGPYIELSVSDTGVGIDPDIKDYIFEPFFTTKDMGKGTGLGLSTVYSVVRYNKGGLKVTSKLGHGTTFTIFLPRAYHESKPLAEPKPRVVAPKQPATILLVEDEAAVAVVTRRFLEKWGYKVLEAHTPAQALEISRSFVRPIDLLLTDVVMPEISGYDLALVLKKQYPDIKVLYMSGHADEVLQQHGLTMHDINFLQKPFTTDSLADKIHAVLTS